MAQAFQPTNVVTCPFCGYPYPMTDLQREVYRGRNMGCQNCGRPFKVESPAPPAPAAEPHPPAGAAAPEASSPSSSLGADSAPARAAATTSPASPHPGAVPPAPRRNSPAAAGFVCAVLFFFLIAAAVVCSAASDAEAPGSVGGPAPRSAAGALTVLAMASGVLAVLLAFAGLVRTRHIAGPWGSVRTAGRTPAVAGLALGGGGLLIAAVVLSTVKPLVDRQHELARRDACKANLQTIAAALADYVDHNNGRYPDSLEVLAASGALGPGDLVCPSTVNAPASGAAALSPPGRGSYRYAGKGLTRAAPPDAVLVYEPAANHGEVAHILFRDGLIYPDNNAGLLDQLTSELDAGQNPGPTAALLHQ